MNHRNQTGDNNGKYDQPFSKLLLLQSIYIFQMLVRSLEIIVFLLDSGLPGSNLEDVTDGFVGQTEKTGPGNFQGRQKLFDDLQSLLIERVNLLERAVRERES